MSPNHHEGVVEPWPENDVLRCALRQSLDRAGLLKRGRPMRALVMLSGGLDSVALLSNVLEQTDQIVHAHHIEIDNFERRARAESDALARVLDTLRESSRDFEYSVSGSRFPLGKGGGLDLTLSLFVAARVCTALRGLIDVVYTGHRDRNTAFIVEGAAVFHACFIQKRRTPRWLRPLEGMSKADIYASMPPSLADATWSCRKPSHDRGGGYTSCGRCHSCREMTQVIAQLGGGREASSAG